MPATTSAERRLLSYSEVAERYGLRRGTLASLVHRRQIPHVRLGPRFVRFDPDEIERWIDARRVPAKAEEARE